MGPGHQLHKGTRAGVITKGGLFVDGLKKSDAICALQSLVGFPTFWWFELGQGGAVRAKQGQCHKWGAAQQDELC